MSDIATPTREASVFARIESFRRRAPRLTETVVTLAHGAGGKSSAALFDAVFAPAFANAILSERTDAAQLATPPSSRLAFSTDSFVVKPLRFPGGSIGHLAVNGTINDLAMMGAAPVALAVAFVIEEGFPIDELRAIVADVAEAAAVAGVPVVTGDTKVVEHGAADGLYLTSTGLGAVSAGCHLSASAIHAGDAVICSGSIARHGMAVLLARQDLAIDADITSDSAAVHEVVRALLRAAPSTRWLRDATRGGVGTVCNEAARAADVAIVLTETDLPVTEPVMSACELLGIDPLHVANEGTFIAIVAPEEVDWALAALRAHPLGRDAAVIGEVHSDPPGVVVLRTPLGGTRIVDMLVGDPLPRIC